LSRTKTVEKVCSALLLGILGCLVLYHLLHYRHLPVNPDAGYYIPIAKEVLQGATPTVEVKTSYPPGFYYLCSLWIITFGESFEKTLLLVYTVHLLNATLLFLILSYFSRYRTLNFLLSCSYFYSIIIIEGYTVVLEPFQVLFILLSYLFYLKRWRDFVKYPLVGLCLGLSIMIKQYSVLVLIGFLGSLFADARMEGKTDHFLRNALIVVLFFTIPFFAFILFTKANLTGAFESLVLFGGRATTYLATGHTGMFALLSNVFLRMAQMNWLFIPILLYSLLRFLRKDVLGSHRSILPIFVFSALPVLVRQFSHYFQLVAPWSYIITGILLTTAISGLGTQHKVGPRLMGAFLACSFLLMPLFLVLTPSFSSISKLSIAFFTSLLVLLAAVVTWWGMADMNKKTVTSSYILLLAVTLFFETIFLSLKVPYAEFARLKSAQIHEAREIGKIFPPGSAVLVFNDPQLYILCAFKNPINDFSFFRTETDLTAIDWNRIDNIVIQRNSPYRLFLYGLGYREIGVTSGANTLLLKKSYEGDIGGARSGADPSERNC
jgi:hypothetical protein